LFFWTSMAGREAPKRYNDRAALDADIKVAPGAFVIVRFADGRAAAKMERAHAKAGGGRTGLQALKPDGAPRRRSRRRAPSWTTVLSAEPSLIQASSKRT
jgi:hypothetical protein